jgi:dCTP deaminase
MQYYPPWRQRLLLMLEALEAVGLGRKILAEVHSVLGARKGRRLRHRIAAILERLNTPPVQSARHSALLTECMKHALAQVARCRDDILRALAPSLFEPDANRLRKLVDRLAERLPPNTVSDLREERAPSFAEILNATWLELLAAQTLPHRDARNVPELQRTFAQERPGEGALDGVAAEVQPIGVAQGAMAREELLQRMHEELPIERRIVVTPVLSWRETIKESAIDVRLDNQFILFRRESMKALDVADRESLLAEVGAHQDFVVKDWREALVVHPRQLVIGSTLEYVSVPEDALAYVIGKSTWGRMGLVIATATKVDPGFKGCITLEIVNEGDIPLVLYPGLPIAQLVFHATTSRVRYQGRYACPIGPEYPKFKSNDWSFWLPGRRAR